MSNAVLDNSRISKHLGQISEYKDQYDPGLLVKEPRSNNRKHLSIQDDDLPFVGSDTWNAYEVSGLTTGGMPVAGVTKIVYPCDSKYIVESKSIKLYFNSYNMYKCAPSPDAVLNFIDQHAADDLSRLLETDVQVKTLPASYAAEGESVLSDYRYITLEEFFPQEKLRDMQVDTYAETPELLELYQLPTEHNEDGDEIFTTPFVPRTTRWHSSLLKSNCRVTSQPDWGDVYIMCRGQHQVTAESLLRYIISFRDECHFHEEICETIYKRLLDALHPEELVVTCLYARRGGIDINPVRGTSMRVIERECADLINPAVQHMKTAKQ